MESAVNESEPGLRHDSTQALGLTAPLSTFKVKVLLPNSQTRTFEFPSRYTVDRVKTEIFAYEQSLQGLSKLDFQLGLSDADRLKVEFVKFKESSESVRKLFTKGEKIITVGLYPRAGVSDSSKPSRAPLIRRTSVAAVSGKITHAGLSSPVSAKTAAPSAPVSPSSSSDTVRERSNSITSVSSLGSHVDPTTLSRRAMSPNRKILQISLEQKRLQKEKEKDVDPSASTQLSPRSVDSVEISRESQATALDLQADVLRTPVVVPILDLVSTKKKRDKKDKKKDKDKSADGEDGSIAQKLRSKKKHSKSLLSPTKSLISEPRLQSPKEDDVRSSSALAPSPNSARDRSPIRVSFGRSRASSFSTSVNSLPARPSLAVSGDTPLDSPRDPDVFLEVIDDESDMEGLPFAPKQSSRPLLQQVLDRSPLDRSLPEPPKARTGVRARSNSLAMAKPAVVSANVTPVVRRVNNTPGKTQLFQSPKQNKSRRASFGTVSPDYLAELLSEIEEESSMDSFADDIRKPINKRLSLRSELNLLPLMKVCKGWWVELGDKAVSPRVMDESEYLEILNVSSDVHFYKHYFSGNDHQNYIGIDDKVGPYVLSVVREKSAFQQNSMLIRTLLRTKKGDDRKCIQEKLFTKGSKSKASVNQIMKAIAPSFSRTKLQQIKQSSVVDDLIAFEDKQMVHAYKFGVLYCQEGQTREEEMFSNETGSADFEEFLSLLGDTVVLKGFQNYRGGLDNQHDSTGTHSIYSKFRDYEMMFHVSTMLPYSFDNPQQLERKRHLGNDIVVVVFKEGNTPYVPSCISSDFNHVVAVISAVRQDGKLFYRLSVASKDGVPAFSPSLPDPALFEAGPRFREILLCKLINGERASLRAPSFSEKIGRTRYILLKDLEEKYLKL